MYILDTDHLTFEEQMRGWMSHLAQARSLAQQVEAYDRLKEFLDRYLKITVLKFDSAAAAEFQRLKQSRLRIGTMDLKIAAIALAHQATVLTRNSQDFSRVPGLQIEDWAA